jgi:hypothetical protein
MTFFTRFFHFLVESDELLHAFENAAEVVLLVSGPKIAEELLPLLAYFK